MSTILAAAIGLFAHPAPQHCLRPQMSKAAFVETVHKDDNPQKLWNLKLHLRAQTCGVNLNLAHFNPDWDVPYLGGKLGNNPDWKHYEVAAVDLPSPVAGSPYGYSNGPSVRGDGRVASVASFDSPFSGRRHSVVEVKEVIITTTIAPVPLPASGALLLLALGGLVRFART